MSSNVIDNSAGNTLSLALDNILPSCEQIDALVGYFYFSGFREVYKDLKDKKIRILVGMDIDPAISSKLATIEESSIDSHLVNPASSRVLAKERYYEQFAEMFNGTDWFDSDGDIEAFKIFLSKIKEGSLEIRKTAEPNHGKSYILTFKKEFSQGGTNPGVIITGSSNLTRSGLSGQGERNRVLRESHYYEEEMRDFEKYWASAGNIVIADAQLSDEFENEIKKRLWLFACPEPYLVYLRVLDEYFSSEEVTKMKVPKEITGGKYSDLQYQIDAINLGIDRIEKFGGVIIADVVGLGKSIIASAIAHNLALRTVIIAPPHLKDQWEDYRLDFGFNAEFFSTGSVEKALNKYGGSREELLIVLDEAHKHRNEDTANYQALHKLCAGNKVMALSATPFNNDPKDIYALIKLFNTPGQSTLRTVENLSMEFHNLIREYKNLRTQIRKHKDDSKGESAKLIAKGDEIAERLRLMIEPIVIRRSRLDLEEIDVYREDLRRQGVAFAKVNDPELLEYDLGELTSDYIETLNLISPDKDAMVADHFVGARYKPAAYLRPSSKIFEKLVDKEEGSSPEEIRLSFTQAQTNVSKFMRRLLVRRFESSRAAFESSLDKMCASSEGMLDWLTRRKEVPIYKNADLPTVDDLESLDEEEVEETLDRLEGKGLVLIPAEELLAEFEQSLKSDIQILQELRKKWSKGEDHFDPKFNFFLGTITNSLQNEPARKIVVFTEFSDTANYIQKMLQKAGFNKSFKYSSSDSSKANKNTIRENFDAGMDEAHQKNNFDILVATDAISEGFNLHRAGTIINYDIPYNPTRVIQRIGRINRVNKKVFDELNIYNFFPTPTGERETKTKAISTLKISIIHALMGEDAKILTSDEKLRNYFAKKYREENDLAERKSWDAVHRNIWKNSRLNEDLMNEISKIPLRTRIRRISPQHDEIIVAFGKRGKVHVFATGINGEVEKVSPEVAMRIFACHKEEKSYETTGNFDPIYQEVKRHLFKNNTHNVVRSRSRRSEAIQRLTYLSGKLPQARDYCEDVIRIIKDYDALPDGLLRSLGKIDLTALDDAYSQLKEFVPLEYIEDIEKTADRAKEQGDFVLLSEELTKE